MYLSPYKHSTESYTAPQSHQYTLLHTVITNVHVMSHLPFLSNALVT